MGENQQIQVVFGLAHSLCMSNTQALQNGEPGTTVAGVGVTAPQQELKIDPGWGLPPSQPQPGPRARLSLSPGAAQCFQVTNQLFFIRFISFISHFFNVFNVSLVSSQVTEDFEHCVEEDNSFY